MSNKEMGDVTPEDKGFTRKANSIKAISVKGRPVNKYAALVDRMSESSFLREGADVGLGYTNDGSGTSRVPIMYVDPMFDPILLMFPKENLKELNRRLRHYYSFHPIVRNLINLHSTFPFGDMEIRCEDKELEPYWQDLGDRLNLMQMIVQMSRDYELLGECHRPGTKILMCDGTHQKVECIRVGDEVVTASGMPGIVKYRTSKQVNERLVGLSIDGKKHSWMTSDHPVLKLIQRVEISGERINKRVSHQDKLDFVRADELKVGDLVAFPKEIFIIGKSDPLHVVPGYEGIKVVGELDDKKLVEIVKISHRGYKGKVYSMEIKGDPTYIADGIIVHNSFHVGNFDDTKLEWEQFHQYPPENIEVHKVYAGSGIAYFLKPDEELRKMLGSSKEIDRAVVDMLPPDFKEQIAKGKPFHLDNSRVIHYANKSAGYLTRGESPLKAALKYLLAEDKLYMLMLVFIDRHMFPMKIWKIGSKEQKWLPSKKHFEMLKQKLIEAKGDPDYDLIYHAFLEMEYKTGATQHEDLIKWFDWTQKRILIAMFANEAMFAEANPYAKEAMSIKLIMHRYMLQRALVNRHITDKVWLPVAKKREYIIRSRAEADNKISNDKRYVPDVKKFAVPKIFWRPSNLVSGMQEQEYLAKMRKEGDLPAEVIHDLLGYDTDKIKAALEREQSTVLDPGWRDARKEVIKDPAVRNSVLKGHKLASIELPRELADKKSPGRPTVPEGEKKGPEPATIPNSVMSPREKQQAAEKLPAPKGEAGPAMPEV